MLNEENKINEISNPYKQNDISNIKNYILFPDNNYLIYVDFTKDQISNKGNLNINEFDYIDTNNSTPLFINNEFPEDKYSKALIANPKSKLNISPLDLSNMNKFTIEIDLKLITEKFDDIKLFINNKSDIYMYFENEYLIVNIINNQLKNYYKFIKNDIIHIVLQKINNLFYLIIDQVLIYVSSIPNLSNFTINTIYDNYSYNNIIYINRYAISNIIRYDLKSLKIYPIDSQSLIYLPYNISSNIIKSDINTFDINVKNNYFTNNYFKTGYGAISNGSTIKFTPTTTENFSLYFWHNLFANKTILSNLDCTLIKIIGNNSNNDCVFEIKIENNYILILKSYINKNEESISLNISDKAKNMYNTWNNFAITFDVKNKDKCVFTIFLNGKQLYSNSLLYFNSNIIKSIELFTKYLFENNIGNMYLASIRLSKGIYYNKNFYPNVTGLLYKTHNNDISNTENQIKPKIIYSKYPKNNTDFNTSKIFNKYQIPIKEKLSYYFTFECWLYSTENNISDIPMCIKFIKQSNILYTIYFTKDNKNSFIRTDNNISQELFAKNQWTHIALTYSKDNNKIKIWINGNLIITENYTNKIALTDTEFLEWYPGSGDSYFNDLYISSSIKYISKNFIPPNTLLQQSTLFKYDKYQNIPYIIHNNHIFGDTNNCMSITNTKFIHKLTNYSDITHSIKFWLYITKNTIYAEKPLSIKIYDNDNNNIHEIILTKYLADNTNNIHWDKNITDYQISNIILPEKIWVHFALIYNKSINKIQLYCNGVKILESEFKLVISLKTFKKIIITSSDIGETYIDNFVQTQYLLYSNDNFIPKNGKLSGSYLPLPKDDIENLKNTDRIGILDNNYITYLDFENQLEDKSKYKVIWNSYGFIQYVKNVFSYDKDSNSILLNGNDGIYTNDPRLNLNNLDKFTIELEIKSYIDFVEQISVLFINFYSLIVIYLNTDGSIKTKYNCKNKQSFILSSTPIDLDNPIYIALQKNYDIVSLYINGELSGQIKVDKELENYISLTSKNNNHVIDIGMITINENKVSKFFNGYINKIAISNIARFDDDEMDEIITIPKIEKNDNIILYQPIKYPYYDNIYKTVNEEEEWNWKYRRRNVSIYMNKTLNSNYNNYRAFGPSETQKLGFIEYSSSFIDFSHRSFTFEFLMNKERSKTECKLMSISSIFYINIINNNIICEQKIIDMEYNDLTNNCRYFVITYNNSTKILNLFINGKLLFTNKYDDLLPIPIRLYTNCLSDNPIYFSSIRLSKGILYTDNFNISFIKQPYTDYTEDDIVNNEHKTSTNDTVLYLLSNNDTNDKLRYTFSINNTKIYER